MRWLALVPLLLLVSAAPPAAQKRFMVTGFDRIRVAGPFEIEIVPGSPQAVVSGDARALDHVAVRVEGSTLMIGADAPGWKLRTLETPEMVKVTVQVPALGALSINGGARVRVAEMRGGRVELSLGGSGSIQVAAVRADDLGVTLIGDGAITLAGAAARARVRLAGTGSVDAEGLTAGEAILLSASSGALRMRVRYTVQVNAQGSGGVTVLGSPKCRVSGPGPVDCANR